MPGKLALYLLWFRGRTWLLVGVSVWVRLSVSEYLCFCACVVINPSLFHEGDTRMSCLIVRALVYVACFRSRVLAFGLSPDVYTSLSPYVCPVFICGLMLTPQVP